MEVKIQMSCSVSNNILKTLAADWEHIFYRFQNQETIANLLITPDIQYILPIYNFLKFSESWQGFILFKCGLLLIHSKR